MEASAERACVPPAFFWMPLGQVMADSYTEEGCVYRRVRACRSKHGRMEYVGRVFRQGPLGDRGRSDDGDEREEKERDDLGRRHIRLDTKDGRERKGEETVEERSRRTRTTENEPTTHKSPSVSRTSGQRSGEWGR